MEEADNVRYSPVLWWFLRWEKNVVQFFTHPKNRRSDTVSRRLARERTTTVIV